ncbi:MAG: hypothetical protein LBS96_08850 [Oscillospiraceae bacterium]|jgi:hypothetical protein|nr:hypothetical protein [Oscillospiraceae bacterium]
MYNNIGGKIKGLAKIIGIGGAMLSGFALFICLIVAAGSSRWGDMMVAIIVLLILIPGCIVGSYPLYGFGELVEKVGRLAEKENPSQSDPADPQRAPKESAPCSTKEPLSQQELLAAVFSKESVDQYVRETNAQAKYVPLLQEDVWFCACGAVNQQEDDECVNCALPKETVFASLPQIETTSPWDR